MQVAGWTPAWTERASAWGDPALTFSHRRTQDRIEVRLIVGEAPGCLEDIGERPELVGWLGFAKLERVSDARSTPYGWAAVLDGPREEGTRATVFVALQRHGARALLCWAPVGDGSDPATISRAEAAKVCASIAPAVPEEADRDEDGIADGDDACIDIAEPRDGADDDDGCPDSKCQGPQACYQEGADAFGRGDLVASFAAQRRGCDAGHGLSCAAVGRLYRDGEQIRQSYERAAAFYRTACRMQNAIGCHNLGWAMERGLGVEQNAAEAEVLYAKGCALFRGGPSCEKADIMRKRRERR